MDPLSVAASVIALLGTGGKIVSLLSKVTTIADAPALATDTLMGVTDISTALRHIGDFVNGAIKVPAERQKYVRLDYLLATLTGCLTTYFELEAIIDSLKIGSSGMSVFDRAKWTLKEASIKAIVQRLEIYKSSLNLMLSIMKSTSITEIHQTATSLHSLMEQLLGSDDDLYRRLSRPKRARTISSGASNTETIINNSADNNADNATIRPVIVTNRNTTEKGFTADSVSADFPRFKHSRPKTHPQTRSTCRKTATPVFSAKSLADIPNISAQPLPICAHEVGNSSWYAVTQAPTVTFLPTRAFDGMVQDLKKILSFKTSTKKERVASDLTPEQAPISRPRARNRQLSGTRPPLETKPPSRTKPPSGNKPHSGTRVPSGNKPPSRTRLSSGNKPLSGTGQPQVARPQRGTRSLQRVIEGEPEDKDIIDGITVLYTLIDQHAEQFYGSEYTNYARRIIGESFGRWIFSGDNDDTILKYISKTLAVYRHDPTDEGYLDHLAQIYEIADKQKRMIQRHPLKWRIGSFKDKMLRPSVRKDGVIILDAEYTGMLTNLSSLPKESFWN